MSPATLDALIPIVLFVSIAVVVGLFLYFKNKSKREMQKTMRTAIEKGQELTPEVIERLGSPPAAKNRDLRRGIISLAIGAGFIALGLAIPEEEAVRVMLGVSSFPIALGLGFLLMHKLSPAE
ncbi:MAG: DUF6249 domain-containing protein [Woeseiaceae bacterium]|nr:DUF6249 domain-containing protein [Woeseiaceae bacterium]